MREEKGRHHLTMVQSKCATNSTHECVTNSILITSRPSPRQARETERDRERQRQKETEREISGERGQGQESKRDRWRGRKGEREKGKASGLALGHATKKCEKIHTVGFHSNPAFFKQKSKEIEESAPVTHSYSNM